MATIAAKVGTAVTQLATGAWLELHDNSTGKSMR
jgi:hypothetical protein